jgi:hypothetical protein
MFIERVLLHRLEARVKKVGSPKLLSPYMPRTPQTMLRKDGSIVDCYVKPSFF